MVQTSFQDWEDKQLVQIALQFESQGIRVTWDYVARRMKKTRRSPKELRLRLASLKRTHGKIIRNFPVCFFASGSQVRSALLPRPIPRRPPLAIAERIVRPNKSMNTSAPSKQNRPLSDIPPTTSTRTDSQSPLAGVPTRAPEASVDGVESVSEGGKPGAHVESPVRLEELRCSLLTQEISMGVVKMLFRDVSAGDIRQRAGQRQNNAGEILPSGVARMLNAIGPLDETDVFLDIGAGIGNVLAQVALSTEVSKCIGVEVRSELCSIATEHIHRFSVVYPLLQKIIIQAADVRDVILSSQPPTSEATIVFANYFLFEESAKLVVARELSTMRHARTVVSSSCFCPRHRSSCSQPFCARWKLVRELKVECSWKSPLTTLYIYQ